jgi:hypothetical protein
VHDLEHVLSGRDEREVESTPGICDAHQGDVAQEGARISGEASPGSDRAASTRSGRRRTRDRSHRPCPPRRRRSGATGRRSRLRSVRGLPGTRGGTRSSAGAGEVAASRGACQFQDLTRSRRIIESRILQLVSAWNRIGTIDCPARPIPAEEKRSALGGLS